MTIFAILATGKSAATLQELRDILTTIPEKSIAFHFQPKDDYSNDFSRWVDLSLHDSVLSEQLGVLEPKLFSDHHQLRKEVCSVIDKRIFDHKAKADVNFHFLYTYPVIFKPNFALSVPQELKPYEDLLGFEIVNQLCQLGAALKQIKIVHVNSTKEGGGVAEILNKMVPLTNALDIQTSWVVIDGEGDFFECTKGFHNLLQGHGTGAPAPHLLQNYEETAARNAQKLKDVLEDADIVIIHDPQPLPLIKHFPHRKGKWIWRCHIDCSHPSPETWDYLVNFVKEYDASIFSLDSFARPLMHPIFIIPPSIDPFSEKNIPLDEEEIIKVQKEFNLDPNRPIVLQVSRFDRFKDPLGVIQAYQLVKQTHPEVQLVLAGGGASDDPEGEAILKEVKNAAGQDPDIHILYLPSDAHRTINALQRSSDIILQKSLKEGFGLTITEALWKEKPVIGGNTGGIRLQVIDKRTGFLVNTPEGAALRIRYLLDNPDIRNDLGLGGKKLVMDNFLITRHLRDYLTVMAALLLPCDGCLDLRK